MRSSRAAWRSDSQSRRLLLERLERRVVPSFVAPLAFDVRLNPQSLALGDVNRDGLLDVVVASQGNSQATSGVGVLLGNGDGSFQPARNLNLSERPRTVVLGDVNNDGSLDIAAVRYQASGVSVLLGNGDGSFRPERVVNTVGGAAFVVVGEFNGDSCRDLAVGGQLMGGNVNMHLGNCDGTFRFLGTFPAGTRPVYLAAGDVNGDGRTDLAVLNSPFPAGAVSVLRGNGDGSFQAPQTYGVGDAPTAVTLADLNGDGRLDLVVSSQNGNNVSVLLGNGDGLFQSPRTFPTGRYPRSVAVGDLNGDTRPDLATANWFDHTVSVLLGNGDGSFGAARNLPVGNNPYFAALADVDADSALDLAVANSAGSTVSVLLGNGDGAFQAAPAFAVGNSPKSVAVGDVNGDGRLDVAAANYVSSTVSVLLGTGDGAFHPQRTFAVGTQPHAVVMGEFNGDGRLDLAVVYQGTSSFTNGGVSLLLGNGDGSFQPQRTFAAGTRPFALAVGRLDGDSCEDLAVANFGSSPADGSVSVLLGNCAGSFQPARNFAAGNFPRSVAIGDVNGDGRRDLAVGNGGNQGGVSVLLGNGDGTFQAPRGFAVELGTQSVALGDVNGDNRLDLAVANSGSVSVLLGNGDGNFQPQRIFDAGFGLLHVAIADVNRDGSLDLVVPSRTGVRVLVGNGDGSFRTTHISYVAGTEPAATAVADLDGDTWPDLAVANSLSSSVSFLRNDGYWGGPAVYFYIYPESGTVMAGQPFDVYVISLSASFEVVTNYTGQIYFYATDPQAITPVYYRFRLSDQGIASFPGGLTFRTLGVQELYVFDYPAIQVFGYAAYTVVGAGPSSGGGGPAAAADLFVGQELGRIHPTPAPAAVAGREPRQARAEVCPREWQLPYILTARTSPASRLKCSQAGVAQAVLDYLFAQLGDAYCLQGQPRTKEEGESA